MDEALAGHATYIQVDLLADGWLSVTDNGRGIPVDPHPKFPKKSALEVIMCTLHAGGKFDSQVYETSGGLHGVGVSVVNALSEKMEVEVARGQQLYKMTFMRGAPKGGLEKLGKVNNRRGTSIRFKPDPQIFGDKAKFDPARLFRMARAKAYLFGGVEIRWSCDPSLIKDDTPAEAVLHFPGGLKDYLAVSIESATRVHPTFSPAARRKRPVTARRNGRSALSRISIRSSLHTATRSRPATAAPTRAVCVRPCSRDCAIMPPAPIRKSALRSSPATT